MSSYLYMIKVKLLLAFNYRAEFFIGMISKMVLLSATAFFWKAAYKGIDVQGAVNERQMLIYSVISIIMSQIFSISVEDNIRSRVRMGNVAVDFIKPVNVFLMYFSEDIGNAVTSIVQKVVPIIIFSVLFIVTPVPYSILHFMLFAVSAIISYMILWFSNAIFGLFYFWAIDMGPLGTIKDYLILILSGSFVPIWFFPQSVQAVLKCLPFIYMYQHPISIYIGKVSYSEAAGGIFIQIVWTVIFALIFNHIKKRVERNVLVQGG